jgi:hypothetical protein
LWGEGRAKGVFEEWMEGEKQALRLTLGQRAERTRTAPIVAAW